MRALSALGLLWCLMGGSAVAHAQENEEASESVGVASSLAKALEARLTVWQTPEGERVHVSHCRNEPQGCRSRVVVFARWIAEVARSHAIDAFVLAAMAIRESGLNPFARGSHGEYGLIQLHPQGIGRNVRFVQSEGFRAWCRSRPGACQREVLEIGARHLADAVTSCGSIAAGLGAYNSGVCGETRYTRLVLEERAILLELAKTDAEPPAMRP
jgi:hypothetical protein